jgi:hypothetical protein
VATCAAVDCGKSIASKYLMCGRHWGMVPFPIQNEIWAHYRPGQERDVRNIAPEYWVAFRRAVNAVAKREGKPLPHPQPEYAV